MHMLQLQGVSINFDRKKVFGSSEQLVSGAEGVTTVFQDSQLMHSRTVYENIAYPLREYIEE